MERYIVLLRGINVGSKNRIKMKDLIDDLSQLNFENIEYYIQSGNILLDAHEDPSQSISEMFRTKEMNVPVVAIPATKWIHIYNNTPYGNKDITSLHATFLHQAPEEKPINLDHLVKEDEHYTVDDKVIYLHIPGKYHKSKLSNSYIEKTTGVSATTRNWKTVSKLYDMLQ